MGFCLLALAVVGLVSSITAQFFAAKAAVGFSTGLRQALFDHIQGLDFTNIDKAGTSTMITRMTSDINQVQSGVNMVLRLFLRSPIIVFGAMIMAFTIDVKSALVFVVAIPMLAIVVFGIMMWTMPLYKKVQSGLDKVLGVTRENLTGVRVIRAFHQEKEEEARFMGFTKALADSQIFVGKISAVMNPVTFCVVNGAIIVLIYIGAIQVDVGNLSRGEVVAIINYMSQILVELVKLANLIITMTKSVASAQRIAGIFEIGENENTVLKSEKKKENPADGYKVVFEKLSFSYENAGEYALTDIDFKVKKGETIGIIGGTGSGKTSLVHLIPAFYQAEKGAVFVDGKNVLDYNEEKLREKIGIVMQKSVLFQGTIRENILWGNKSASDSEILEAIETAQAGDILRKKEKGLDEWIEQGGRNLSGGQRQRLSIARALVRKPEILIFDDSASALDYATDAALRKALQKLDYHPTVFIVSQRTSSIMHADKIIVLDDGHIEGIGTHTELLENCLVYKEIYDSQFKKEAAS